MNHDLWLTALTTGEQSAWRQAVRWQHSWRILAELLLNEARRLFAAHPMTQQLVFCKDAYEAAQGAHALLIATEWKEFRGADFERLKTLLKEPVIFDGRNLYEPALLERMGLYYVAVGRGRRPKAPVHVAELKTESG